eukprot:scaffold449052_cov23-Prasinocladus_malaysianus.AAC.1
MMIVTTLVKNPQYYANIPIRGGAEHFSQFRGPTSRINAAINTHHDIARACATLYFHAIRSSMHFNLKARVYANHFQDELAYWLPSGNSGQSSHPSAFTTRIDNFHKSNNLTSIDTDVRTPGQAVLNSIDRTGHAVEKCCS